MSDRSRRAVLAGAAGLLAATAGCSVGVGGDGDDGRALVRLHDGDTPTPPHVHPLAVPDAMVADHRERTRTLLERVPADPDISNELVARQIREDREHRLDDLAAAVGATPDDDATDREQAARRLADARETRARAAELWGRYRAATGAASRTGLERRRDTVRDRLAAFRAAWDYRAGDPVRAAMVHEHLEGLVGGVERGLEPWPPFPEDPAGGVAAVGYLFEKVEAAAARMDDLARYREQVANGSGHRAALLAATNWLRRRARRRTAEFEAVLEEGPSAFDRDLGASVERLGVTLARDVVRDYSNGDLLDIVGESHYAGGLVFAATRRAAVEVMGRFVADARDGESTEDVGVDEVATLQSRARTALRDAVAGTPKALLARLLGPAFHAVRTAEQALDGGDDAAERAAAGYLYAERAAAAATAAAEETTFLLAEADG